MRSRPVLKDVISIALAVVVETDRGEGKTNGIGGGKHKEAARLVATARARSCIAGRHLAQDLPQWERPDESRTFRGPRRNQSLISPVS